MTLQRIYLDNNATTSIDPQVIEVMLEELQCGPSNPSSIHFFGQEAKKKLVGARHSIANFFNVKPSEILFTSGGTEGINFLIKYFLPSPTSGHILSTSIEHPAIDEALKSLKKNGVDTTFIRPDENGAPSLKQIEESIRSDTQMIVLSGANSETGVKIDLDSIADFANLRGIPLVIDGVGLLGRDLFSLHEGISGIAFSGHKIHGPKGIGFVIFKSRKDGEGIIKGGGQERGLRSGTENLAGILGLNKALEILLTNEKETITNVRLLRDRLEEKLLTSSHEIQINGIGPRVANTSNVFIPGLDGESLLIHLDMMGIAASHGSACNAGSLQPSRTLLGMNYSQERARHSIRFSLSRYTTVKEIDIAIQRLISLLEKFSSYA